MRQKIIPSLLALHKKNDLPGGQAGLGEGFEIIGISRKNWQDAELREYIKSILVDSSLIDISDSALPKFLDRFTFLQGDVSEESLFEKLAEKIGERKVILYFSLSPALYKNAFENLTNSSLNFSNLRVMIEKPFGRNGSEAKELDTILHSKFQESQLYRVDHYLAKETLRNLPKIDLDGITKIELWFLQKEDLEKRGPFYDATGALRDVGQNHMLEMLGSLAHGQPREYMLKDLHPLLSEEVATKTKRAQWHGYREIAGVAPNSQIETYFFIESRWRDAVLTLEAGKYMEIERKEIIVTFKDGEVQTFPIESNKIRGEHEALIYECLQGDNTHFITSGEAALQWAFVDPILESWKRDVPELTQY